MLYSDNLSAKHPTGEKTPSYSLESSRIAMAVLLTLAVAIRLVNLHYNTLFLDDAIYSTVGREVLVQVFDQRALSWMFGSYLYPISSALVNELGGVAAIRLWSIALNMIAILGVYLATTQFYNRASGFMAAFLFAFSGPNISLAQLGQVDSLSIPLLAMSFALAGYTVNARDKRHYLFLQLAVGVVFTLAILSKYISLFYFPAVFGPVYVHQLLKSKSIVRLFRNGEWIWPVLPPIILFGSYAAINFADLRMVFSGQYASQSSDRAVIAGKLLYLIGIISCLALFGMAVFVVNRARQPGVSGFMDKVIHKGLMLIVFLSYWSLPLYHVYGANVRSMEKHVVFALVFLCPIAGYGIATFMGAPPDRPPGVVRRLFVSVPKLLIVVGSVSVYLGVGLHQHCVFQFSWPNVDGAVDVLEQQNITRDDRILGSAAAIYEYYLGMSPKDTRTIWTNIWYVEVFGLKGDAAIRAAIETCRFSYIVTDDFYSYETHQVIVEAISASTNYEQLFSEKQTMRSGGTFVLEVYRLREKNACPDDDTLDELGS